MQDSTSTNLSDSYVATYVDREDKLVAICACDRPFVTYSGAALSMIPATVANEMIEGAELTDAFVANFHEVMNICAKLMMSDDSAHLKLQKTLSPAESADAISSLTEGQSCTFTLDIPQYGKGALSFFIAP